jgi:hypothetical protein
MRVIAVLEGVPDSLPPSPDPGFDPAPPAQDPALPVKEPLPGVSGSPDPEPPDVGPVPGGDPIPIDSL